MDLESLRVGRVYRVKQNKQLIDLRLKQIQTLKGKGTDLYELKITTEGHQLWMLDELSGKGYVIKNLSQIQHEVREVPKKGSLVQIVSGKMKGSLGSITVYRVADADKKTVTLHGGFKNYVLPLEDVRVYESTGINPETLLSDESKRVGEMPKKYTAPPAQAKSRLTSFLKTDQKFGSMSDEHVVTKEEKEEEERKLKAKEEREKLIAENKAAKKDKEKKTQTVPRKPKEKDWLLRTNKGNIERTALHYEDAVLKAEEDGYVVFDRGGLGPKKVETMGKGPSDKAALLDKKPKGKKQKITEAVRPSFNSQGAQVGKTYREGTTHPKDATAADETIDDEMLAAELRARQEEEEENAVEEVETERPEHLNGVTAVPMKGGEIHPDYFEQLEQRQKANGKKQKR